MASFPLPPIKPLPALAIPLLMSNPFGTSVTPTLYLHCNSECFPLRNHQKPAENNISAKKLPSSSLHLSEDTDNSQETTIICFVSQPVMSLLQTVWEFSQPSSTPEQNLTIFQVNYQHTNHQRGLKIKLSLKQTNIPCRRSSLRKQVNISIYVNIFQGSGLRTLAGLRSLA